MKQYPKQNDLHFEHIENMSMRINVSVQVICCEEQNSLETDQNSISVLQFNS